jgi:CheY-like chemotaxis protein
MAGATPEPGGNETILVVEDEEGVRSLICRALRDARYTVLEARHGEDALTILQQHHGPAHAVVTDLVMPQMGGAALIKMLHSWYPSLKVLFVSGYSEETVASAGSLFPGASYLPKPFSPETLVRTMRLLLDSATAAPSQDGTG